MMLRSQPSPSPPLTPASSFNPPPQQAPRPRQSPTISIRDIMKEHDLSMRGPNSENNNILPPSLTDPNYQPDTLARNMVGMFAPPPHIESEASIEIPIQREEENRSRTPRRRRIFKDNPSKQSPTSGLKNIFSLSQAPQLNQLSSSPYPASPFSSSSPSPSYPYPQQSQPQYSPNNNNSNPIVTNMNLNNSFSHDSTPNTTTNMMKKSSANNPNNNSSMYQTVNSMRKSSKNSPKSNTVYHTLNQIHPQLSSQPKFILDDAYPSSPTLNNNNNNNSINSNSNNNSISNINRRPPASNNSFGTNNNNNDPMTKLRNGNTQPVPVYESNFHTTGESNPQTVNYLPSQKVGNSYQPYYSDGQNPVPAQALINALVSPRNNMYDPNNNKNSRQGSSNRSPSFAYPFNQDQSFNTTQPVLLNNTNSSQNSKLNNNNNQYDPYERYRANSAPMLQYNNPQSYNNNNNNSNNPVFASSPFQQNQKEQLRQIPKKFTEIQAKVMKQQHQLQQLNQKFCQTQLVQLQAQKTLLTQLIQKQQQLTQKQRQINNNLEYIGKLQSQSNFKKQQMLKYQLELQQAKRVQRLHLENQRLVHQIARGETTPAAQSVVYSLPKPVVLAQPTPIISPQIVTRSPIIPASVSIPSPVSIPIPVSLATTSTPMMPTWIPLTPATGSTILRPTRTFSPPALPVSEMRRSSISFPSPAEARVPVPINYGRVAGGSNSQLSPFDIDHHLY